MRGDKAWGILIAVAILALVLVCLIGSDFFASEDVYNNYTIENDAKVSNATSILEDDVVSEYGDENFSRDYEWEYGRRTYRLSLVLYPEIYDFFKERDRVRDYDLFASDYYSKEFIRTITETFENYADENDFEDEDIPYFVISFIQSLPYTSDNVTTGFDEYPRFPYETIYDDGGDCEDTAILASAMLNELGYSVILLEFPKHMAVGIGCEPSLGQTYYTYDDVDYCYLETTGEDWDIGEIPDNVDSKTATVHPINDRAELKVNFSASYRKGKKDVFVNINATVKNLGSEVAEDTVVYVALQTKDEDLVWDSSESEYLQIKPESSHVYSVKNLHCSADSPFRIYIIAYGEDVVSDKSVSEWIFP